MAFVVAILGGLDLGALHADQTTLATASVIFPLELDAGSARSTLFGPAYAAMGETADAFYSNPAGLAGLDQSEISLSRNALLVGTTQEGGLLALNLGDWGGSAISFSDLDYGSLESRDNQGTVTGSFDSNELDFGIGWGKRWMNRFDFGLSLKGLEENLYSTQYSTFNADLGAGLFITPSLRLGLAYANLGPQVLGYNQASAVRGGIAWIGPSSSSNVFTIAAGAEMDIQSSNLIQAGIEDQLYSILVLRAAYQMNFATIQANNSSGLRVGMAIQYQSIILDYAYIPDGDLGQSQQFGLSYKFGDKTLRDLALTSAPVGDVKADLERLPGDSLDQAKALELQGKNEDALNVYQRIVHDDPANIVAWNDLAVLYYDLGRKELAIQCYEAVLRLQPGNTDLKQWLDTYKKQ